MEPHEKVCGLYRSLPPVPLSPQVGAQVFHSNLAHQISTEGHETREPTDMTDIDEIYGLSFLR